MAPPSAPILGRSHTNTSTSADVDLLQQALEFAAECEADIKPEDRKRMVKKILDAREKWFRLQNSQGWFNRKISRWGYLNAAKDAHSFAKCIHRKAVALPRDYSLDISMQHLYRCYLTYTDAFPNNIGDCLWGLYERATGDATDPKSLDQEQVRRDYEPVMCDSLWYLMCLSARIRRPLETWDNAIKCQDADAIFRNMSDIYECRCPAPPNHGRRCLNWVVQEAINVLWFRRMNKVCRAAKAYPGGYDAMPIPVVALAITVIQLCMHERTHGILDKSHWPVEVKYNDHCQSIGTYERGLSDNTMDVIRREFLKRARVVADQAARSRSQATLSQSGL